MPITMQEIDGFYNGLPDSSFLSAPLFKSIRKTEVWDPKSNPNIQRRIAAAAEFRVGLEHDTYQIDAETLQNYAFLGRQPPAADNTNLLNLVVNGTSSLRNSLTSFFSAPSEPTYFALHETIARLRSHVSGTPMIEYQKLKLQFIAWIVHQIDQDYPMRLVQAGSESLPLNARNECFDAITFGCTDYVTYRRHINPDYETVLQNRLEAQSLLLSVDKTLMGSGAQEVYNQQLAQLIYVNSFRARLGSCTQFAPIAAYILYKNQCSGMALIISSQGHNFVYFEPKGSSEPLIIDLWLGAVGKRFCYKASEGNYPMHFVPDDVLNHKGEIKIP